MRYKCVTCKEEFEGPKGKAADCMCPYCGMVLVNVDLFKQINDKMNKDSYNKEDIDKILKEESSILDKVKGSALEKVRDQIKLLFTMVKDPNENLSNKLMAVAPLLYVLNPVDFIPDIIPILGYVDDCAAVSLAIALLGKELGKYVAEESKKMKVKDNRIVLYSIIRSNSESITAFNSKNGMVTWGIPNNMTEKIKIKTLTDKFLNCNGKYIEIYTPEQRLVPVKNFDKNIIDNIFKEALVLLKALGVKNISWSREIVQTDDKKAKVKMEKENVFSLQEDVRIKNMVREYEENSSSFEPINLLESMNSSDFVNKLAWFFTEQSIVSDDIISDRFERNLTSTKVIKEIELDSLLDMESRLKIMKKGDLGADLNISLYTKAKWEINIEYYSLVNEDKDELSQLYNRIKNEIEERRSSLSKRENA